MDGSVLWSCRACGAIVDITHAENTRIALIDHLFDAHREAVVAGRQNVEFASVAAGFPTAAAVEDAMRARARVG